MSAWKTYLYSYRYDDRLWSIEVPATDFEDAHLRAMAIRQSLRLDGELMGRIPAEMPGSSLLTRAICAIGNMLRPRLPANRSGARY